MFVAPAVFAVLAALVAAHGEHHQHAAKRQAPSAASLASAPLKASSSAPVTTLSFQLASTNPTAIPLASIVSNQPSSPTIALPSTAVPGTIPTYISGSPPLPNAALLAPSAYPSLDVVPPTDSPEVLRWIQEVANTGVVIPNITLTNQGGCPNNSAAVADSTRCWWTCGGCTRSVDITDCPTPLDWGFTYDDGPSFYTPNLLSYLNLVNLRATFFVVGSRVISFPATLQNEYISQHQIAVHTWSHPPLTTLSNDQIIAELGWSKKVIKDVLGVTPNMMRPPYGDIDDRVRAISLAMGLTPVIWTRISPQATFDTDDFDIRGGSTTVEQVLSNWETILKNVTGRNRGFIVLEHDLFQQTVEVATGYIIPDAMAHNPPFNIQPVVACQKLTLADAYIETNNNSTNPPAMKAGISAGFISTTSVAGSTATSTPGGASSSSSLKLNASFLKTLASLSFLGVALTTRL